ncbi:MAG: hypothetical protein DRI98_11365 [Bacteroidetes bacterium]|nr:MAG: hypothetical protein DRI98_11365 [Bacteroidota bacterium]
MTPYVWAKLVYMRDKGNTEVGGFAVSKLEDPLYVEDFFLVPQEASQAFVSFDDEGIAEFQEEMLEQEKHPCQCTRIWIHTHPSHFSTPSSLDEETFQESFGNQDWSVMFILDRSNGFSCRLQTKINKEINYSFEIDTEIDWSCSFKETNHKSWDLEYKRCVKETAPSFETVFTSATIGNIDRKGNFTNREKSYIDQLEKEEYELLGEDKDYDLLEEEYLEELMDLDFAGSFYE